MESAARQILESQLGGGEQIPSALSPALGQAADWQPVANATNPMSIQSTNKAAHYRIIASHKISCVPSNAHLLS
jgi:hypothetical protein